MNGFFYTEDEKKKPVTKTVTTFLNPCENCGLYRHVRSPKLGITGKGAKNILILGEAQGATEDAKGRQFVGDAGSVLREHLEKIGLDFDRDFYALNAVRCRPTEGNSNRTPTPREIQYCHQGTWKLIKELNPRAIWLFGAVPLRSYLLDKHQEKPTMARWRGWCIPDYSLKCWVIPLYHPSYIMYNEGDEGLKNLFTRDLEKASLDSSKPFPKQHGNIKIFSEYEAVEFLRNVKKHKKTFVFDFETTGLKPHKPGHEICYLGLSTHRHEGIGTIFTPAVSEILIPILTSHDIKKRGFNIKFEDAWTFEKLRAKIKNWDWDGMIAAHILDDREDIYSLEFQAAVNYGDWDFKNATEPYLKTSSKSSGNDFNTIKKCPPELILTRTAKDAMYEFALCEDQIKVIKKDRDLHKAYNLFHEGILALAEAEERGGILCDLGHFKRETEKIDEKLAEYSRSIEEDQLHYKFRKVTGSVLNPLSPPQLVKMFFTIGQYTSSKKTKKGKDSIDNEVLAELARNSEIRLLANSILGYRKYDKLKNTYIGNFVKEEVEGIIRPFFNLHTTRTFRSSSSLPNFQNIPVRDFESKEIIRRGLFPHKGHRFVEIDFSGMEVRISACYNKDPALIRYIKDPTSDMHRDSAEELFFLDRDQVTKDIRYESKSNFVFAQFYGSYWKDCANGLWNGVRDLKVSHNGEEMTVYRWLKKFGIGNLTHYEQHVRKIENKFWKKFSVYHQWREEWINQYIRTGQVPMYHGFRRQGHLKRNEIINSSIQGTAFHLLLWSFIQLVNIWKKEKWDSKVIGQIHDSIVLSVNPKEFDHILQTAKKIMTQDIVAAHPFIIVPIEIEVEATDIDQPWATKKEIKL